MEKKPKKKIVEMLLNKELDGTDEEELLNLLIDEPIAIDIDKQDKLTRKKGDAIADKITKIAGSWIFIISFIVFLIAWIFLNIFVFEGLDDYPFILLNLLLSCLAALQAPVIMMSQNRESKKDSLRNLNDYKTDLKSELILEELHDKMDKIITNQKQIQKDIASMKKTIYGEDGDNQK